MPSPHSPPRLRLWAVAVLLAAVATYAQTLGHGFAFDDDIVVVRNRLIRSLDGIPALATRTEWAGGGLQALAYRPLTDVSYAVNHAVSGLSPWSYHAANVLLHAAAAALVLALGLRLGLSRTAAGAGTLLFAVHPLHVEAVANVVGRKDVLATVLVVAAVLLHRAALRRGGARLALAPLAYAGAMAAKEVGVVAIALAALVDLALATEAPPAVLRRRRAVLYAGMAATLVAYLVAYRAVTAGIAGTIAFEDNPLAQAPLAARLLTAVAVIGKGLLLHVLPSPLSPDYSYDAIPTVATALDPRFLASAAVLATWSVAGWALRRRAPIVLLALGWYLVALLPASNLLFPVGTIFGERLLYLPSVATALLAGAGFGWVASRLPRPASAALLAGAAAWLAVLAVGYAGVWRDDLSLFRHAAAAVPRSSKVHHKLAVLLIDAGDLPGAGREIERAVALRPASAPLEVVRAEILRREGRRDEEGAALARALSLSPQDADALYAMGRRARYAERLDEAQAYWERALAAKPRHAAALADLSTLRFVRGDRAGAQRLAEAAVDADERQANAWYNLGLLYQAAGDGARARGALERFVGCASDEYRAEIDAVRARLARGEPR